jgi:hypothetical protein
VIWIKKSGTYTEKKSIFGAYVWDDYRRAMCQRQRRVTLWIVIKDGKRVDAFFSKTLASKLAKRLRG